MEKLAQAPTPAITFKKVFNICFYVAALTWVSYVTFILIKYGIFAPGDRINESYLFAHATLVGFVTYKAVSDLKLGASSFFKKYNLHPLFISFAITAPLSMLPLVLPALMGSHSSAGLGAFIADIILILVLGGQLYWLLVPILLAIAVFGKVGEGGEIRRNRKKSFFAGLGYIIFYAALFNPVTAVVLFLALPLMFKLVRLIIL